MTPKECLEAVERNTPEKNAAAIHALYRAVNYLLTRAQTNPDLGYEIGPGTESFHRLCSAEALVLDQPLKEVEALRGRDLQPEHDKREPMIVVLRRELDALR